MSYNGLSGLDITRKTADITGDETFAPSWKIVRDHQQGKITDDQYIEVYYKMMLDSQIKYADRWKWLLDQNYIVLKCFCKKNKFCHRIVLALILKSLGAKYLGEVA